MGEPANVPAGIARWCGMASTLGRIATATLIAVPAILVVFVAFRSGGYFPGMTGLLAAEILLVLGLWLFAARRPFAGWTVALVVAGAALAGLWIWVRASQGWSPSPTRAVHESNRVVLYLGVLLLTGSVAGGAARTRWLLYLMTGAFVLVSLAGLTARLLPEVISYQAPIHPERLGYPLSYWNALGIVAGLAAILCGHLSCSTRDPRAVRVLGAAAVPLMAATVYYTFSRGATWASLIGVLVYVLVARPRAWLNAGLATVPTTLVALAAVNPANRITKDPLGAEAVAAGRSIALTLGLCALAAAVIRAGLLPLDRRFDALRLPARARRPVLAATAVAVLVAVVGAAAAVNAPSVARAKWQEFERVDSLPGGGTSRLFSLANNGRIAHWDVALDAFGGRRLTGTGAGTYEALWGRDREVDFTVRDAHSLYFETLGELGIVGMVLLGSALLLVLGAFAARARGPERGLYGALLAAGVAWALHAGVDWDWELPAVTLWFFALGGAALARRPAGTQDDEGAAPRPARARIELAARVALIVGLVALILAPARTTLAASHLERGMAAIRAGDCGRAIDSANASLRLLEQASPYQLLTWCYLRSDPKLALKAMRTAVSLDATDWQLHYDLAVATAANGRDPRPAATTALRLNPRQPVAQAGAERFAVKGRRRWRQAARTAPLMLP